MQATVAALTGPSTHVLYTCCEGKRPVAEQVLRAVQRWLPQQRGVGKVAVMLTMGTPNIGKSSLVNQLKAHAVREGLLAAQRVGRVQVGPLPGVTKQVSGIRVRVSRMACWHGHACWCGDLKQASNPVCTLHAQMRLACAPAVRMTCLRPSWVSVQRGGAQPTLYMQGCHRKA